MGPFFFFLSHSFLYFSLPLFLKTCSYLITLFYMLNASSPKRKTHTRQFYINTSSLKNSFLFNNYIFSLSKNMLAVSLNLQQDELVKVPLPPPIRLTKPINCGFDIYAFFFFFFFALIFSRKIRFFKNIAYKKILFLHKIKWFRKWSRNFSYLTCNEIEMFSKQI